jgi:hypothetical protein
LEKKLMTLRPLGPLLAVVLACSLTACGGSDEPTEADSSSESPSAEPEPEATGEDYATLTRTLFESGNTEGATTAEQLNEGSDFPEGVSVVEFEQETQTICIQDENLDIGMRFIASGEDGGLFLLEGLCEGGEEVSEIGPDESDPEAVAVQGDEELGQPVADYFLEQFGGN